MKTSVRPHSAAPVAATATRAQAQADQRLPTAAQRQALAALDNSPRQVAQRRAALAAYPITGLPLLAGPVVQPVWHETALGAMGAAAGGLLSWLVGSRAVPGMALGALGGLAAGYLTRPQPRPTPATQPEMEPQLAEGRGKKLPANEMWKLYINPKDFEDAQRFHNQGELAGPGAMYDEYGPKTPIEEGGEPQYVKGSSRTGYQRSMEEAIKQELLPVKPGEAARKMDFAEYQRLHQLGIKHLTNNNKKGEKVTRGMEVERQDMSNLSGRSTAFPINDWDEAPTGPAQDLLDERLPMPSRGEGAAVGLVRTADDLKNLPQEERGNYVTHFDARNEESPNSDDSFHMLYDGEQGKEYTNAIFTRYYNEIEAAKDNDDEATNTQQRLQAVVRATRALHITHTFKDGNGRLNGQLVLNKLLLEQGFNPTILPADKGLGVLGGAFSVPELADMVKQGAVSLEDVRQEHGPKGLLAKLWG